MGLQSSSENALGRTSLITGPNSTVLVGKFFWIPSHCAT